MTIKRLNYFTGQFLEAEDFKAEQKYHIDMRRRGNSALYYSAGILDGGFLVTQAPGDPTKIVISSGIGIDILGRELVITDPMTVSLPLQTTTQAVFVTLRYSEKPTDTKTVEDTVTTGGVTTTTSLSDATRQQEEPDVKFEKTEPADAIVIGKITIDTNGNLSGSIDVSMRQFANVRFPHNVIVGQGGNGVLKTRHIDGKNYVLGSTVDDNDHLYLNWNTRKDVYLGFGENTKSSLYVSGNTGIGTNQPQAKLEIVGGGGGSIDLIVNGRLKSNNNDGGLWVASDRFVGGYSTDKIGFYNGGAWQLTVQKDGNVGIGTAAPKARLDIEGNALLGYETTLSSLGINDFGVPLKSGFYQNGGSKITGDVPDPSHSWTHLITTRHSNSANNHQLQIAASYADNDRLYFRKIQGTGTSNPVWKEIATRDTNQFTGDQTIQKTLTVGSNPIHFTSGWSGFPNSVAAEISNDTSEYKTLMIIGNSSAGLGRRVSVWDRLEVNGILHVTGEIQTTSANAFRMVCGNYGSFFRNDGSDTYLLLTNQGDQYGGWNGLRPLRINNSTGEVVLSNLNVTDNFAATIGCADFRIGHSGRRGSPGRALVDYTDTLHVNYGADWKYCKIGGTVSTPSSRQLKDNIQTLSSQVANRIISTLEPVTFTYKRDNSNTECLGFIAEDTPPEVATPNFDAIVVNHIVAALTRVVKDQERSINILESQVRTLMKSNT